MSDTTLRILVDLRETMQKQRIGFGNRVGALERAADEGDAQTEEVMSRYLAQFRAVEELADADIRAAVKEYPIYEYLSRVKGLGPTLSAQLIAMIDIERAQTVSALWRYAGLGVVVGDDGVGARERPVKGEKLHYNARLKKVCYLIGTSFLKSGSPYRAVYDAGREYYEAARPEWTKARQHMAAQRRMVKHFLAHLWEVWRKLEGLPTRELYVVEKLGHTHVTSPADYGWYDEKKKPARKTNGRVRREEMVETAAL